MSSCLWAPWARPLRPPLARPGPTTGLASDNFLGRRSPASLPFTQNKEVVTPALCLNPGFEARSASGLLPLPLTPPDPEQSGPAPGRVTARWSPCPQCFGVKMGRRGGRKGKSQGCVGAVLSHSRCSRVGSTNLDVTRLAKTSLDSSV